MIANILIVDDNRDNLKLLGSILTIHGYKVRPVTNGLKALTAVQYKLPDIILLDLMMPGMDGYEVCRRLKANENTRHIPVLFISALDKTTDKVTAFEVGGIDFITKPFQEEELLARVRTHLEIKFSREIILRKNNEQKTLLHVLSHDLMNSINALQNFFKMVDADPDMFFSMKATAAATVANALAVIEQTKLLNSLDGEENTLKMSTVNLRQMIDQSLGILKNRLEQKRINVDVQVDEDVFVKTETTSFVNSVLNNVLTNAIKFSHPASTISIGVSMEAKTVVLIIEDAGIGIPKEWLERIFEMDTPFSRLGTLGEKGTGFGMPLVKKFMEAYGGRVEIFSPAVSDFPNVCGTRVKLYLPFGS